MTHITDIARQNIQAASFTDEDIAALKTATKTLPRRDQDLPIKHTAEFQALVDHIAEGLSQPESSSIAAVKKMLGYTVEGRCYEGDELDFDIVEEPTLRDAMRVATSRTGQWITGRTRTIRSRMWSKPRDIK